MEDYRGCSICEEDEDQGGQRKDRSKIKRGDFRKVGDHISVDDFNRVIGQGNSSVLRMICCLQLEYQRGDGWTRVKETKGCI